MSEKKRFSLGFYIDGVDPPAMVRAANDLCGSPVVDPRPDLKGMYLVVDIETISLVEVSGRGWILVGTVAIEKFASAPTGDEKEAVTLPAPTSSMLDGEFGKTK